MAVPRRLKRLRERFKRALQDDPQFAREYRAETKAHQPPFSKRLPMLFISFVSLPILFIVMPLGLIFVILPELQIEVGVARIGYALTVVTFMIAELLLVRSRTPVMLLINLHGPVANWEMQRGMWKSVWPWTLIVLPYLSAADFVLLAPVANLIVRIPLAIVFALLQWGFALGAGTSLAGYVPKWRHGRVGKYLGLIWILGMIFVSKMDERIIASFDQFALYLPTSWVGIALWRGVLLKEAVWLLGAVPALLTCCFIPRLKQTLIERFSFSDYLVSLGLESETPAEESVSETDDRPAESSENDIRDLWRNFDQRFGWTSRDWQSKIFAALLNPRERELVTFLSYDLTSWSSVWNRMLLLQLAGAPVLFYWLGLDAAVFLLTLVQLLIVMVAAFDKYPGLYFTRCSGSFVSHFANYPLGTGELSRTCLKLAVIKSGFYGLYFAPLLAWIFRYNPLAGLLTVTCLFTWLMSRALWKLGYLLSGGFTLPNLTLSLIWVPLAIAVLIGLTLASPITIFLYLKTEDAALTSFLIPALVSSWIGSLALWWMFKTFVDRGDINLVKVREPRSDLIVRDQA